MAVPIFSGGAATVKGLIWDGDMTAPNPYKIHANTAQNAVNADNACFLSSSEPSGKTLCKTYDCHSDGSIRLQPGIGDVSTQQLACISKIWRIFNNPKAKGIVALGTNSAQCTADIINNYVNNDLVTAERLNAEILQDNQIIRTRDITTCPYLVDDYIVTNGFGEIGFYPTTDNVYVDFEDISDNYCWKLLKCKLTYTHLGDARKYIINPL